MANKKENRVRAENARNAVKVHGDDNEEGIVDLLVDIHHLCELEGLDFDELEVRAYNHYLEEKRDQ